MLRNDLDSLGSAARSFISKPLKLFIGGEWQLSSAGDEAVVFDPSSALPIAQVQKASPSDVDVAVACAKDAFGGSWARTSPAERERLIWRLADLIEQNAQELAELESLDNGKAVTMARGLDIPLAVQLLRYMAGYATKLHGRTFGTSVPYMPESQFFSYTTREPVGVVGAIIPWNMPLLFVAWKLGPALASGCTVVLKPASDTPLTALRIAELVAEAGFPAGTVNVITGAGGVVGEALARHADVDKIAFTGSTEVGMRLAQICGEAIKPISLELGGKSPSIVMKDADFATAIGGVIQGIFANSGQVCAAGSRLYVDKAIYEPFLEALSAATEGLSVGPGLDPATFMGPLVSRSQKETVCSYIESGIQAGAELLTGGAIDGTDGHYVRPTILANTTQEMTVVREEIFGPVLTAAPFDSVDQAVEFANDSIFGLASSIYSRDINQVHSVVPRIKAGTVWVNCHNVYDAALPFGGYKKSGIGREMGEEVFNLYTQVKAVCMSV